MGRYSCPCYFSLFVAEALLCLRNYLLLAVILFGKYIIKQKCPYWSIYDNSQISSLEMGWNSWLNHLLAYVFLRYNQTVSLLLVLLLSGVLWQSAQPAVAGPHLAKDPAQQTWGIVEIFYQLFHTLLLLVQTQLWDVWRMLLGGNQLHCCYLDVAGYWELFSLGVKSTAIVIQKEKLVLAYITLTVL